METHHILLIEDELDMRTLVARRLEREGFQVAAADDGSLGLRQALANPPDLVLLDLMLPTMNGLDVLRRLRDNPLTSSIPIIILSAKGEESDIVVGLELGADDYVPKPFSMSVLIARIHALLRRSGPEAFSRSAHQTYGNISIDTDRHQVSVRDKPLTLTRTEYRILLALSQARGRVLTRDQLIDQAIGSDAMVTDRTIDVHVTSLRGKLGDARSMIKTVRGVGYRMATEIDSDS